MLLVGLVLLAAAGGWLLHERGARRPATPIPGPSGAQRGGGPPTARYVGAGQCAPCHVTQYQAWRSSHHELAMQPANAGTVLGDFNNARFRADGMDVRFVRRGGEYLIRTEGPDARPGEFKVKYTFGAVPLQQYLLELPGGRLQAFTVAWDTRPRAAGGQRWLNLYPGQKIKPHDELHWSGPQQNWNFMCADCHSTDLRKNYDAASGRFATTWSEINVGCEACHGPGSAHLAWARDSRRDRLADKGLTVSLDERRGVAWARDAATGNARRSRPRDSSRELEVCAQCHALRAQLAEGYYPGRHLLDHYRPVLPTPPAYFADGQQRAEVYIWGSFLQSRMHARGVTCSDCHEPHSARLRAPGNALCATCHAPARYDTAAHHFHEAGGTGAQCVACHMPDRLYMVIDARRDHSLRVPRPDVSVQRGMENAPNACNNCHRDKDARWAAAAVARWYGPSRRQEPHFGTTLAAAASAPGVAEQQALAALADDRSLPPIVRAASLQTLARQPGALALRATRAHVQDGDELVRLAAVDAAALWPPGERLSVLARLDDERLAIRLAAVSALVELPRDGLSAQQRAALDRGIAEYRRAQNYNADRAEAQCNLGQLDAVLGNAQAAAAAYYMALRLNPHFTPAYIGLAQLQAAQGREPDAEQTLRQALEQDPDSAAAHHALGLSLVRARRLQESLPELREAAALQREMGRYAYVYAVALHESGDAKGAIEVLRRAADAHPADAAILQALTQYAAAAGDDTTAATYAARLQALPRQ